MSTSLAELMARKARTAKRQLDLVPPQPKAAPGPAANPDAKWPPLSSPGTPKPGPAGTYTPGAWGGRDEWMAKNRADVMLKAPGILADQYRGDSATGSPFSGAAARKIAGLSSPVEAPPARPQTFTDLQSQRDAVMQERIAWGLKHPFLSGNKIAQRLQKEANDWYAGKEKSGEGLAGDFQKMGLPQPEGGLAGRRITEPGVYDPLRQATDEERTRARKRQAMTDRLAVLKAANAASRFQRYYPGAFYRLLTEEQPDINLYNEMPRAYQYRDQDGQLIQEDRYTGEEKRMGSTGLAPEDIQPMNIGGRPGSFDPKHGFKAFAKGGKSDAQKDKEAAEKEFKKWEASHRAIEDQAQGALSGLKADRIGLMAELNQTPKAALSQAANQAKIAKVQRIDEEIGRWNRMYQESWARRPKQAEQAPEGLGQNGTEFAPLGPGAPGVRGQYAPPRPTPAGSRATGAPAMSGPPMTLNTKEDVVVWASGLAQSGMRQEEVYQVLLDAANEGGYPNPHALAQEVMWEIADLFPEEE